MTLGPSPLSAATSEMRAESLDEIAPIALEWDDLADRMRAAPWARPGWIAAWWKAFGAGRLHITCVRRDGRLDAILPMYRRAGALRSPTNAHTPEFTWLAADAAAAALLIHTVFENAPGRVSLSFLDVARPEVRQLRAAALTTSHRLVETTRALSPYLEVDGDWDAFKRTLSRNQRQDVSRRRRRLEEIGHVTVEFSDGRAGLDELLEEGFQVEAAGWKGTRGTAIASLPQTRGFYTEIARWASERHWLQLGFLRVDGRAVSFQMALACDGSVYCLKSGYDAAFRQFAPGKLLMYATIEHAFAHDHASRVEFLGADEPYKRVWSTSHHEKLVLEAFAPTLPGLAGWTWAAHARPIARRVLKRRARPAARGSTSQ